ncbi:unnamed protein product [Fusarium venenatum]|uniref:Uncharacterized protein n=1 Tax=Fusarium venenatum TaxID=56646 RepID=A0A2L2TK42_9HYPO|nr:uncharacterized protein FVRRES_08500 [Fusarium venenatum]CEI68423.1 unnamed protein product [Fusarium venenatum]
MSRNLIDFDEQFSDCLSALDVLVGLGHVLKRVDFVDGELKLLGLDEVEKFRGVLFEISALRNIAVDYRAHQADVLGCETEEGHRVHGTRLELSFGRVTYRVAKGDESSLESNQLKVSIESSLSNTIKDNIRAMSTSDLLDLGNYIIMRVDNPPSTVLLCELKLLIRASSTNDLGTDSSHIIGDLDGIRSVDNAVLSIGTDCAHKDHPSTVLEALDRGVDINDSSRSFTTERKRELRCLVKTRTEVGIYVVKTSDLVAHKNLTLASLGNRDIIMLKNLNTAVLVDLNGLHGRWNGSHFSG